MGQKSKDDKKNGKPGAAPRSPAVPEEKMSRREYERLLRDLQIELLKFQKWVQKKGRKIVILFEGRDGAGKGGTILRIMQHLSPRSARVVALAKPSEVERGQWYFQRYVRRLPTDGEIVLFDRSWYNRAGVERVMGFCADEEYEEFMRAVPEFETMLVKNGTTLLKFWLDVTKDEQKRRLKARRKDPLKQWKLSPLDDVAQEKWDEYTVAKHAMFQRTHQPHAPWLVVRSNDKKRGRINCIRALLHRFDYAGKDKRVACEPDFAVVGHALNPDFGT